MADDGQPIHLRSYRRRSMLRRTWDHVRLGAWRLRKWAWRYASAIVILGWLGFYSYTHRSDLAVASRVHTPSFLDDAFHGDLLWRRPAKAPNGKDWPRQSGYIEGYPLLNRSGRAGVTADNSGGAADLFVKLIDRDRKPLTAVRIAFVKAGGKFAMEQVRPGHYDLRYQNLSNGRIRMSRPFEVTVNETKSGREFMGWNIGLFSVVEGTEHHADIGARDF